jgi:hypothetical protein
MCVLQLRKQALGYSASSNPYFAMRRRFQKLYSDFKPHRYLWRLVYIARKFLLGGTTVMFNKYPLFQVCMALDCGSSIAVALLTHPPALLLRRLPWRSRSCSGRTFCTRGRTRTSFVTTCLKPSSTS